MMRASLRLGMMLLMTAKKSGNLGIIASRIAVATLSMGTLA